jgi:predicted AlkP superfamily phosphohydrolase/phosphomutase
MPRVFLFGIDGAPPELVFGSWLGELPNIKRLMERGCYARLESAIPPSTIVAWNSMISGGDTSEIGVFSYTRRGKGGKPRLVNSRDVKCELMWDILGRENKKTIALYVPLSYPARPINGAMVSGFLTPGIGSACAYPESLREKIKKLGNTGMFFDVAVGLAGHKGLDPEKLIEKTYEMTEMQLRLLKELLVEPWDFFMAVMIGTDRLQHMLWRHFDETHRRFIPNSRYRDSLKEYYIYLDRQLGGILKLLDEDTVVIVASDHGMVKQEGKININNWLMQEGYLVLKGGVDPKKKAKFSTELVDMGKSLAYGGGAYNARVYINRAKAGKRYKEIRKKIASGLKQIRDDRDRELDTRVYFADEIYKGTSGTEMPDLIVYFDDLRWASNPDLGQEGLYSWESALGADSAGHSRQGCFVISGKGIKNKGQIADIDIRQVAATILWILGVEKPKGIPEKIEVS